MTRISFAGSVEVERNKDLRRNRLWKVLRSAGREFAEWSEAQTRAGELMPRYRARDLCDERIRPLHSSLSSAESSVGVSLSRTRDQVSLKCF
jgi:hypothetical protein